MDKRSKRSTSTSTPSFGVATLVRGVLPIPISVYMHEEPRAMYSISTTVVSRSYEVIIYCTRPSGASPPLGNAKSHGVFLKLGMRSRSEDGSIVSGKPVSVESAGKSRC